MTPIRAIRTCGTSAASMRSPIRRSCSSMWTTPRSRPPSMRFATDYKPAHTGERPYKIAIRNPATLEDGRGGSGLHGHRHRGDLRFRGSHGLHRGRGRHGRRSPAVPDHGHLARGSRRQPDRIPGDQRGRWTAARWVSTSRPRMRASMTSSSSIHSIRANIPIARISTWRRRAAIRRTIREACACSCRCAPGPPCYFRSNVFTVAEAEPPAGGRADNAGPGGSAPVKLLVVGGTGHGRSRAAAGSPRSRGAALREHLPRFRAARSDRRLGHARTCSHRTSRSAGSRHTSPLQSVPTTRSGPRQAIRACSTSSTRSPRSGGAASRCMPREMPTTCEACCSPTTAAACRRMHASVSCMGHRA